MRGLSSKCKKYLLENPNDDVKGEYSPFITKSL